MWIYLYIIMQRKTFKQIVEKTVIGVTTLATLTSLHGYFLNLKDKEQFQALTQKIQEIDNLKGQLTEAKLNSLQALKVNNMSNIQIQSHTNDLADQIYLLTHQKSKLLEAIDNLVKNVNPDDWSFKANVADIQYHVQELIKEAEKASNSASDIVESIRGQGGSNFTNIFNGVIEKWYDLLNSLSFDQMAIFANTLVAFLVLLCLFNIILIIYGEFLIEYFKLEERFPKLAKLIQLRRKLRRFYMSTLFSISIISLSIVIYLNIRYLLI